MLRAIVGDVADYQRLKTGREQSGLLFSIFNVTNNTAAAIAVGLSYPLIAWFGFVPGHANTHTALAGLALLFALGPATGHLLSALLIRRFPLNETRQAEIRLLRQRIHGFSLCQKSSYPSDRIRAHVGRFGNAVESIAYCLARSV